MAEPKMPDLDRGEAPSFAEPWQAKTFAMVVLLHRQGHFAWEEWVRTLASEISAAPQGHGESADQAYHRQFLRALERIAIARGLTDPETMVARKQAWRHAYLGTPHGQPVELTADQHGHHRMPADFGHAGDLIGRREPLTVSVARRPSG